MTDYLLYIEEEIFFLFYRTCGLHFKDIELPRLSALIIKPQEL